MDFDISSLDKVFAKKPASAAKPTGKFAPRLAPLAKRLAGEKRALPDSSEAPA
ncbi:hypothetical protein H632_c4594p0, partial [Helicosporidium sp. ATCC 50920]